MRSSSSVSFFSAISLESILVFQIAEVLSFGIGISNSAFIFYKCGFNISLVFNFVQLSGQTRAQQFIIKTVVILEETIVDNNYETKRQCVNPIVKNTSFILKNVEPHFNIGYSKNLVAARICRKVLCEDQMTRGEFFFELAMSPMSFC